jgi:hypothetical protein
MTPEAGDKRQAQESMRDRLAERGRLGKSAVDMKRVEVAGQAGELDDVRLRDGPRGTRPGVAYLDIVKREGLIAMLRHHAFSRKPDRVKNLDAR